MFASDPSWFPSSATITQLSMTSLGELRKLRANARINGQLRVGQRLFPAQLVEPARQGEYATAADDRLGVPSDQVARTPDVSRRNRMRDRCLHVPVLLEPFRGSNVQHGDALGLRLLEFPT